MNTHANRPTASSVNTKQSEEDVKLARASRHQLVEAPMTSTRLMTDDVTYLIKAETRDDLLKRSDQARECSLHNVLTGLPNRNMLLDILGQALLRGQQSGSMTAILYCDLDRFSEINESFGRRVGDELLVAVGERLSEEMRSGDTLVNVSGDVFVIVWEDHAKRSDVDLFASHLVRTLSKPFALSKSCVTTTVSVGIAVANQTNQIPEEMIDQADVAMFEAKRNGGSQHQSLELTEQHLTQRRNSIGSEIRRALDERELWLEYQPIARADDGEVFGVEALLRWTHPILGSVSPTVLVQLAERSGLISEVGMWVLEQACLDRHRWVDPDHWDDFIVSVNVSAYQLKSDGFAAMVDDVLRRTYTAPKSVVLELTETVFIQDSLHSLAVLNDLKRIGVLLALDDFGTGYCSFAYLNRCAVDIIKIDQSFIAALGRDSVSNAVLSAVVDLTRGLGMMSIAEGIETAEQHSQVAALGCDACQGYHLAPPMPAHQLDVLMGHRTRTGLPTLPLRLVNR
jgi:diguanylate cyclase (GGDEF)-like protein